MLALNDSLDDRNYAMKPNGTLPSERTDDWSYSHRRLLLVRPVSRLPSPPNLRSGDRSDRRSDSSRGIACCLSFLSPGDFNSAAQSCKAWREAGTKVKSLGASELCNVGGDLPALAGSVFRQLVTSIYDSTNSDMLIQMNNGRSRRDSWWVREHFALLLKLENLTELNIRIDLTFIDDDQPPIKYPPRLQHVVFDIGCDEAGWSSWDAFDGTTLLRGLASCASLTILNLRFVPGNAVKIHTALKELKQLKHFTLRAWHPFRFDRALFGAIRGMTLESLSLACYDEYSDFDWDAAKLAPLLKAPNQLAQLQTLVLVPFRWWDEKLDLSSLPSLTALEPELVTLSVLPNLAPLTKLRTLRLAFDGKLDFDLFQPDEDDEEDIDGDRAFDPEHYIRAAVVVPYLNTLTALTSLHIEHVAFAAADFALLCQSLPLLEVLTLEDDALVSLEGLPTLGHLCELTVSLAKHCSVPLTTAPIVALRRHFLACDHPCIVYRRFRPCNHRANLPSPPLCASTRITPRRPPRIPSTHRRSASTSISLRVVVSIASRQPDPAAHRVSCFIPLLSLPSRGLAVECRALALRRDAALQQQRHDCGCRTRSCVSVESIDRGLLLRIDACSAPLRVRVLPVALIPLLSSAASDRGSLLQARTPTQVGQTAFITARTRATDAPSVPL